MFTASKTVVVQNREHLALFEEGLSFQNQVQVGICFLTLAWLHSFCSTTESQWLLYYRGRHFGLPASLERTP